MEGRKNVLCNKWLELGIPCLTGGCKVNNSLKRELGKYLREKICYAIMKPQRSGPNWRGRWTEGPPPLSCPNLMILWNTLLSDAYKRCEGVEWVFSSVSLHTGANVWIQQLTFARLITGSAFSASSSEECRGEPTCSIAHLDMKLRCRIAGEGKNGMPVDWYIPWF